MELNVTGLDGVAGRVNSALDAADRAGVDALFTASVKARNDLLKTLKTLSTLVEAGATPSFGFLSDLNRRTAELDVYQTLVTRMLDCPLPHDPYDQKVAAKLLSIELLSSPPTGNAEYDNARKETIMRMSGHNFGV